ncbi:MAG: hypothetical protein R3C01_05055 [Planctomycetaceae bacterium]
MSRPDHPLRLANARLRALQGGRRQGKLTLQSKPLSIEEQSTEKLADIQKTVNLSEWQEDGPSDGESLVGDLS